MYADPTDERKKMHWLHVAFIFDKQALLNTSKFIWISWESDRMADFNWHRNRKTISYHRYKEKTATSSDFVVMWLHEFNFVAMFAYGQTASVKSSRTYSHCGDDEYTKRFSKEEHSHSTSIVHTPHNRRTLLCVRVQIIHTRLLPLCPGICGHMYGHASTTNVNSYWYSELNLS